MINAYRREGDVKHLSFRKIFWVDMWKVEGRWVGGRIEVS